MAANDIKAVGIAGAGTMGQGIAISCALASYDTILYDVNSAFCSKAIQLIRSTLNQSVAKGKLTQEASDVAFNRITIANQLTDLKADLIIEAVVENLEVKRKLFLDVERINSEYSILATNTSSIPVSQIAAQLKNSSKCVGLHFFNPAHLMKLVEVISGFETSSEVVAVMKQFAVSIGKVPVEVKDSPGFIVNRVARHFYVESLKVMEDQVASYDMIDRLMKSAGFKMGPFELMDLIGIDVNYSVTKSVYEGFNGISKFKPSDIQFQKIGAGQLGRKTGQGFYDYSKK
ncbi:MAG: 3-hydroxyacyl-CoA dehydrogenase NAD-binding domain-containing protein [Cyclobacteriaceae bacterium]